MVLFIRVMAADQKFQENHSGRERGEEWRGGGIREQRRRAEAKPLVGMLLSVGDLRSAPVLGTFVFHWQQADLAVAGGFKRSVCVCVCER